MTTLFVTSTGTAIGKTFVSCRLLAHWRGDRRIRAIKPVITGFTPATRDDSDTALLIRAQGLDVDDETVAETSPWRFEAALSADMAASRENRSIAFTDLLAFSATRPGVDVNLIEGIGGVMAPIGEGKTVIDWMAAIDPEILLIAGSYLGTLSHTLTAIEALARRKLAPAAIVISQSASEPVPMAETASRLGEHVGELPIVVVPRGDRKKADESIAALVRLTGLD
jgi:dethiobiotin synthetase